MSTVTRLDWRPTKSDLLVGAIVVNAEILAVLLYLAAESVSVDSWRFILYAFVWINAGLYAVAKTRPAEASARTKRLALLVAGGYFLLLAVAGGILGPSHTSPLASLVTDGHLHSHGTAAAGSFDVRFLPPGWGPALVYQGSWVLVILMPYKVIGYLSLAYLVYATVIDAAGTALSGSLGLLSCVSCAWPVVGSLVTTIFGSGSFVVAAATTWPYDISTVAFLATVALLTWRPLAR
ncbi:DUF7546 family protein [Salinigranum halophilum]|jgi:hypothetical protein|uniref:DUF7546 family protein n=1 Tax=Salinigranum halophilum TaxID=2565931 RepID=UPI00115EB82A|nr:hypothetical protein [Salinigranum halophilum]